VGFVWCHHEGSARTLERTGVGVPGWGKEETRFCGFSYWLYS
jgi:hypothetical protein